jgi:hypothetical protein
MELTKEERRVETKRLVQNSQIENPCWIWLKRKDDDGYGRITFRRTTISVHRLAYAVFKGDFDDVWHVCHTCDNPPCINPKHLWLGTNNDNMKDRDKKGRHCPLQGEKHGRHKLIEEEVRQVFYLQKEGYSERKIGKIIGVSGVQVHRILSGQAWKHLAPV